MVNRPNATCISKIMWLSLTSMFRSDCFISRIFVYEVDNKKLHPRIVELSHEIVKTIKTNIVSSSVDRTHNNRPILTPNTHSKPVLDCTDCRLSRLEQGYNV